MRYALYLAKQFFHIEKNDKTLACLGLCSLAQGKYGDAVSKLDRALRAACKSNSDAELTGDVPVVRLGLAKAHFKKGDIASALRLCLRNVSIDHHDVQSRLFLARMYLHKKQYDRALGLIGSLKDFNSYALRGACYFAKKEYRRSVREFAAIKECDPRSIFASYNLGVIYSRLGDHRKAAAELRGVLRLDRDHAKAKEQLDKIRGIPDVHP